MHFFAFYSVPGRTLSTIDIGAFRKSVTFAEPKQPYPAKTETPDKYTSYHLYVTEIPEVLLHNIGYL